MRSIVPFGLEDPCEVAFREDGEESVRQPLEGGQAAGSLQKAEVPDLRQPEESLAKKRAKQAQRRKTKDEDAVEADL